MCKCYLATEGTKRLLEVGAGPSNRTSDFLASLAPLVGVDVSTEALNNRALTACFLFDGENLPFAENSFDGCISNFVIEHVDNPLAHFREITRVLRPGGTYCLRTPNLYHYVAAISRFTPHWFHESVANRVRTLAEAAHSPWPTYYRCNTLRAIARIARSTGLQPVRIEMVEKEPSYGRVSRALFYPMFAWERVVNARPRLSHFRANIFAAVRKPL